MSVFSSKDRYCGAVLGAFVALIKVSLTCCMKVGQQHECNAVCRCVQLNKKQPVTVHDVLQILRPHISVPQCDVFGYLSIDHLLVVIIAPMDQQPTPLQVTNTIVHTHRYSLLYLLFCTRLCVLYFDENV